MPNVLLPVIVAAAVEGEANYMTVINAVGEKLSESSIVSVLTAGVGASIGLVFLWWAVRKVSRMFNKAFFKGKLKI